MKIVSFCCLVNWLREIMKILYLMSIGLIGSHVLMWTYLIQIEISCSKLAEQVKNPNWQ